MDRKLLIEDIYPLSPIQQGILFHTLSDKDKSLYFVQNSFVLKGEINKAAFRQAWQKVVDRHTVLRTSFIWKKRDEPVQAVHRKVELPIEEKDWKGIEAGEQQKMRAEYLKEDRAKGFNLTQAPLMRIGLIETAEREYELIWSFHHLLMDGWSTSLVISEVFRVYDGLIKGKAERSGKSRAYGDYIEWLGKQDLGKAEIYWKNLLKGFSSPTPLVSKRSRRNSHRKTREYDQHVVHISEDVLEKLRSLTKQHRLTINTVVQGAWALLLSNYTGQRDVVFGVTVSGRPANLPGCETMIGLFINTLPMRVKLEAKTEMMDWLRQLQSEQVELREYEYSPLVKVQGWSDVPRGTPLFDSILVFENYRDDETQAEQQRRAESLQIEVKHNVETTNYPITAFAVAGLKMTMGIAYYKDYFDAATITGLLEDFKIIIGNIASHYDHASLETLLPDAQTQVERLGFLSDEEKRRILIEFNQTATPLHEGQTVSKLFEYQVEKTPNQIALEFQGQTLTYAQLNAKANQLAHYMRTLGVGPDVLVGICMEQSLEFIVGLLGILKAGGAYVPLDIEHSKQRLAHIINDTKMPLILTTKRLAENLSLSGAKIICFYTSWPSIARHSQENLTSISEGDNLAYVIYSSESADAPKGVLVTQRSVVNHNLYITDRLNLEASDRVLQFHPISFDAAVGEIFPTLMAGATLVMRGNQLLTTARLSKVIKDERITTLNIPTVYWHDWVTELASSKEPFFKSLRKVVVSGEKVSLEIFRTWQEIQKNRIDWSRSYGPTEATAIATFFTVSANESKNLSVLSIGKPISNARIYILDDQLEPVPVGESGQIYITGAGLARGYLNCSDLSAERFIPDPFSSSAGARMYVSGDLGRYLPDGEIEFLGSIDHQANGTIDQAELPKPKASTDVDERGEPKDQYELQLVNIFEEVLGIRGVKVGDNFFDLGGHSILALRVIGRIHKQMGREVEMSAMMREPTIRGLARLIKENDEQSGIEKRKLVAIQPGGKRKAFYCVHPIGGQVMCYVGLARRMGSDQPLYGLEAGGLDEAADKEESIEKMAAEYVEEIMKVHQGGEYLLGGWSMGGVIAYEMARQIEKRGEKVGAIILMDTMSPKIMKKLGSYEAEEGYVMALYARSQQKAMGKNGAGIRPEEFKGKSEEEQLRYLKEAGVVPEEVREEYAKKFMEGFRKRQKVIREYEGGRYKGRVVLVRARREEDWLEKEYEKKGIDVKEKSLGWAEEVGGEVEVFEIEAEHEKMMEEPQVGELAKLLMSCFDKS